MYGFSKTFLLLLLLLFARPAGADLQQSRQQLKQIEQKIEDAQIDLQQKKKSEVRFSRQLALLKRTLRQIDARIRRLQQEQGELQQQAQQQQRQLDAGKQQLRQLGRRMEKRLIALYKEGEIGPLKILFSADSPTELVQQYHYLTRVAQHDQQLLAEYRQAVDQQQQRLQALEELQRQNRALLDEEQQQRKVAAEGRQLQARLLRRVKQEKRQLKQELGELHQQAKRLQDLISRLQQEAVKAPASSAYRPFARGGLAWPVEGEVLINFGTQKDRNLGTYYESNGIEIAAPPGSAIHAAADGEVVFADWFKGYGNLLIVNHPGGHHTLYAHVASLNKALGDSVRAGELIGKSGLNGRDSIYFEIRNNGTPVDPLKWLQRRQE